MPNNKNISFRCSGKLRDKFQQCYPYTLSHFLVNCIKLAILDSSFFQKLYFMSFDNDKLEA